MNELSDDLINLIFININDTKYSSYFIIINKRTYKI